MSSWKGKTRGGLLGYKIFVFVITRFGLESAYFILRFVAAYFVLFAPESTRGIYSYFRQVVKKNRIQAFLAVYKAYFIFGQTLVDKVAIGAGMKSRFRYRFDGKENLDELGKTGGFVFSAHLGNWEIAGYLLKESNVHTNILMFAAEHEKIKDYLEKVMHAHKVNIIPISQDISHVFKVSAALNRKEFVCLHGDRFMDGSRVVRKMFMGREAWFPIGPFTIACKLRSPYTFAYAMRGKKREYYLSSTPIGIAPSDPEILLDAYLEHLETKLRAYPLQWFNFYDFWSENVKGAAMA